MNEELIQPKYFFEPLGDKHNRAAFSCGVESLDKYFQGDPIKRDISRKTAAGFVLTSDGISVAGFYTLSSLSILGVELPEKLAKKLPSRSPIGVTLLGRMGVHITLKGQGLGSYLLMDALRRAWQSSQHVASWAVVIDAKEGAREFYTKHEFTPFASVPNRVFLSMKTIEQMFSS